LSFSRNRVRALSALGVLTAGTALAGAVLTAPAQAATTTAPQYTLTITRDAVQSQETSFFGINNNGDIIGIAPESGGLTQEAFLLKAGSTTMQFLGSPGNAHSAARPAGINAADAASASPAASISPPGSGLPLVSLCCRVGPGARQREVRARVGRLVMVTCSATRMFSPGGARRQVPRGRQAGQRAPRIGEAAQAVRHRPRGRPPPRECTNG
jgi:hypothetical protein